MINEWSKRSSRGPGFYKDQTDKHMDDDEDEEEHAELTWSRKIHDEDGNDSRINDEDDDLKH